MDYYSKLQSRLPSSSSSYSTSFPPHRTQLHPRMQYYSPTTSTITPPKPSNVSNRWFIAAAAVLIIPFVLYLFIAAKKTLLSPRFGTSGPRGFGVVINAGRAESRVHVFEYLHEGGIPFVGVDGKGVVSLKVRPGLMWYQKEPDEAGTSLVRLLEFARATVPRKEWGKTKVRLLVNGGLNGVGPDVTNRILESCRTVLRSSGFWFRGEWASTITGQEKGVYAWVAANYALGTLGGDPQETTGIVEFDGDATQITFALAEPNQLEFSQKLKLPGVSYNVYTSSINQISQKGAWEFFDVIHDSKTAITSPSPIETSMMGSCIPKGYAQSYNISIPSSASNHDYFADSLGNFSACRSKSLSLLKGVKGLCSNPPCGVISTFLPTLLIPSSPSISAGLCSNPPCGVISTFLPNFQGKSVDMLNLFYVSELFGLVPRASLTDLEAAGRSYCEDDWIKLRKDLFGIDEADLLKYCFSSAFLVALLHDGIGIPMDQKSIGFTDPTGGTPLDWTLGAFILEMVKEAELEANDQDYIVDDMSSYMALFAVLFFAVLAVFCVLRWQKPEFKMVYDLEKGNYVVTRMPR